MVNEKRLIEELREMAERTPPICQYDKPQNITVFDKEITVYCKPFEQFQELLRRAADALSVDAVEVVHGRWIHDQVEGCNPFVDAPPIWFDVMQCSVCKEYIEGSHGTNYCPNCGAKMDGDGNA